MKIKTLKIKNNYNNNKIVVNISKNGDYVQFCENGKNEQLEEIITISLKDFEKVVALFNEINE